MSDYETKNHSKFLITYHIIFVAKYRQKILDLYGSSIKNIALKISERSAFSILELEVDKDHLHLMIESEPKLSPLQIVRRLKQESTIQLWKGYPELKKHFWSEKTFWSDGYFCCSIGNASVEAVRKYIDSQG